MAEIPQGMKKFLFGMGAKGHAISAIVLDFLGLGCLIVGIISGFRDEAVGLWSTEWFLITIALWVWAFWSWFTAYFGAKEE